MRPYTDLLPLRKTSVWGGFSEAVAIPHRYGRTGGKLIQYDQQRKLFVWADHASDGIDDVLVDGVSIDAWAWRNGVDSTGATITFIEFQDAQDEGAELIARGRGKKHPVTGVLIETPAVAIWDIISNIAGNSLAESALQNFSAECAALDITIGGSIEESITIQSQCRDICKSIGAIFSPDIRGLCKVHPGGTGGVSKSTINYRLSATATANRTDLITSLSVTFDYENGSPLQSIKADAVDGLSRYGRFESTLEARWVKSSRVALGVATRMLSAKSRPAYKLSASGIKDIIRIGETVTVNHPVVPKTGVAIVINRSLNMDASLTDAALEFIDLPATRVELVQQSQAFTTNSYSSIAVATIGDERVFTFTEQDGSPTVNASVTLDGQMTRYTDGAGKVSFPAYSMPVGDHTLYMITADGRELTTTVTV